MTATALPQVPELVGTVRESPAGAAPDGIAGLRRPPAVALPALAQTLRANVRQIEFVFGARRRLGEVFRMHVAMLRGEAVVTGHPDHVRSLFTADAAHAPSITGESPLRPIVGPSSTLTALGERHMRQRKLLLPAFHGQAVQRYAAMIAEAADREIDRWPIGRPFALAPRMQAITLDVIMAAVFGIEGRPATGTPEHRLRRAVRSVLAASTLPIAQVAELLDVGRREPVGPTRVAIGILDRATYAVIARRRQASDLDDRADILSLLLRTTDEDGVALGDRELRDELLTLVLAGHETTANSLAWAFERLVRAPAAYERLLAAVRDDEDRAASVEATIHESMRSRPVVPMVGRRVSVPWRLGEFGAPAGTPVLMSILLLHHREDLYPDPFSFRPERFLGHKPGTYEWIPFGGGIRRCLGATLAMAEQRVVLEAVARRTVLAAEDPAPEHAVHRNVTMIPSRGGRVVVRERRGT